MSAGVTCISEAIFAKHRRYHQQAGNVYGTRVRQAHFGPIRQNKSCTIARVKILARVLISSRKLRTISAILADSYGGFVVDARHFVFRRPPLCLQWSPP
jgi:hypothetical protein